uniref:Uncharacterized protein n=1 Tax=Anopheles coluzzii TaxID=1518534 RepID=A0A6E8VYN9_ANOCL
MTSLKSLILALAVHLGYKIPVFVWCKPPWTCKSTYCRVRRLLIVSSSIIWLSKLTIFSAKYRRQLPSYVQVVVETLLNLAIIEGAQVLVWCALEHHIAKAISALQTANIYQDAGGDILMEVLLTVLAFATAFFSTTGTGYWSQTVRWTGRKWSAFMSTIFGPKPDLTGHFDNSLALGMAQELMLAQNEEGSVPPKRSRNRRTRSVSRLRPRRTIRTRSMSRVGR